jgi:hypothetical protein
MMLVPDNRRRVTLPPSFKAGQPVELEPLEDGTFRLVPMVAIPAHQLWAWQPEAQATVAQSLQEYHAGLGMGLDSPGGQAFLRKLDAE